MKWVHPNSSSWIHTICKIGAGLAWQVADPGIATPTVLTLHRAKTAAQRLGTVPGHMVRRLRKEHSHSARDRDWP